MEIQQVAMKSIADPKLIPGTDIRREKCKLAARSRRYIESDLYQGLADALPISKKTRDSLDKPSILRLTVSDLKLQELVHLSNQQSNFGLPQRSKIDSVFDSWMPNALNGFLLSMSGDGDVTFTSESILSCLGLNQCDVMGKSIYEFTHPCDHSKIKEFLHVETDYKCQTNNSKRSELIRFKSCFSSRGHNSGNNSTSYKVIHVTGKTFENVQPTCCGFIGLFEIIPHPSDPEFTTKNSAFITRHSVDMKFNSSENVTAINTLGGFHISELIGKSFFNLIHAEDIVNIGKTFKSLTLIGQVKTSEYRFLVKNGGWIWVVTEATLINNLAKTAGNEIICRHFVLSEVQSPLEILSEMQVLQCHRPLVLPRARAAVIPQISVSSVQTQNQTHKLSSELPTKSTDYDYAYDMTHLAPVASEELIALNQELFDELLKFFEENSASPSAMESLTTTPVNDILATVIDISSRGTIYQSKKLESQDRYERWQPCTSQKMAHCKTGEFRVGFKVPTVPEEILRHLKRKQQVPVSISTFPQFPQPYHDQMCMSYQYNCKRRRVAINA